MFCFIDKGPKAQAALPKVTLGESSWMGTESRHLAVPSTAQLFLLTDQASCLSDAPARAKATCRPTHERRVPCDEVS